MILRRVIEHVKAQNWTAIAIDFVIVVLGVFVGIQVANWNAARVDRIDEGVFLKRLHDDIVRVDEASARVRSRRLDLIAVLNGAAEKIFDPGSTDALNAAECLALATSHYHNISVLGLPSLVELTNSGRVEILRDKALSTALVEFQQRTEYLSELINTQTANNNNLVMLNPDLVKVTPAYDADLGEFQTRAACDSAAMRTDQRFLNAVAENIDIYDAYLRDGLLPWSEQLARIHRLADAALNIAHAERAP